MEFFAATLESTNGDVYQASGMVVNNSLNSDSETDILDTGWTQSDDSEEFNNYTEEY